MNALFGPLDRSSTERTTLSDALAADLLRLVGVLPLRDQRPPEKRPADL